MPSLSRRASGVIPGHDGRVAEQGERHGGDDHHESEEAARLPATESPPHERTTWEGWNAERCTRRRVSILTSLSRSPPRLKNSTLS